MLNSEAQAGRVFCQRRRSARRSCWAKFAVGCEALRSGQNATRRIFIAATFGIEHGPQSGPQHADNRPCGGGEFFDHCDQRVSTRYRAKAAPAASTHRHERPADPLRSQHARGPARTWVSPTTRKQDELGELAHLFASRCGRRGRQLPESLPADATARAGRAGRAYRAWRFDWSTTSITADDNPWLALARRILAAMQRRANRSGRLDASTAIYSLHLKGVGDRLTIRDAADQPVTLEVVGLLRTACCKAICSSAKRTFSDCFPTRAGIGSF